ncbi:MAG: TolB family protein, partial [Flavobacteriales bacterium]
MRTYLIGTLALLLFSCGSASTEHSDSNHSNPHSEGEHAHSSDESAHSHHHGGDSEEVETMHYPEETHFKNVKQLSYGGDNAEAYWSFADDQLVFQSNNPKWGFGCDQIYIMELDEMTPTEVAPYLVSTGKGRTTCAYFMPGDSTVVYASTHSGGDACPPEADRSSGKYVWAIYEDYDIYVGDKNGEVVSQLTDLPGYDAEATLSPDGT